MAEAMLTQGDQILIIDDDQDILNFTSRVAKSCGFEVFATTDPQEFLEIYKRHRPGVIIQDLQMPRKDGIEILRDLAGENCTSAIMILSGFDSRVIETARKLGRERGLNIVAALRKPIRAAFLKEELEKYVAKGSWLSEAGLTRALAAGEFFLAYQPKLDLAAGRIAGIEALIRWNHPEKGLIPPADFIPFAEETDLMDDITWAIISMVTSQLAEWREEGCHPQVSVNLSYRNLRNAAFADEIISACQQFDLDPSVLTLEITETSTAADRLEATDLLTRLRLRGMGLSIDDFGTGYSSLLQLHRMPFTELKIDQQFVFDCDVLEESRILVRAMTDLGHNLGMTVVAEGVETKSVLDVVRDVGCEMAQGYFISRPVAPADVPALMHRAF